MNDMFNEERNNNQHKSDHRNSPCWSVLQWTFILTLDHHGSNTLRKFTMKCWRNNGGNYCRDDDIHNKIIAASIRKFFCCVCRESTVVYIESRNESSLRLKSTDINSEATDETEKVVIQRLLELWKLWPFQRSGVIEKENNKFRNFYLLNKQLK